jgi:hypothetical protein
MHLLTKPQYLRRIVINYASALGIRRTCGEGSGYYRYNTSTELSMNVTRAPRQRTISSPVEENQTLEGQ